MTVNTYLVVKLCWFGICEGIYCVFWNKCEWGTFFIKQNKQELNDMMKQIINLIHSWLSQKGFWSAGCFWTDKLTEQCFERKTYKWLQKQEMKEFHPFDSNFEFSNNKDDYWYFYQLCHTISNRICLNRVFLFPKSFLILK